MHCLRAPTTALSQDGDEGMPLGYENTRAWQATLGARMDDSYSVAREKLRSAYWVFRERAAHLAAEIPRDLHDYTVHDITHSDALWELCDLIGGEQVTLTPTEGFVLGGAFLIHDLGMGLAAFPGGMSELMTEPGWREILASSIREELGRPIESDDLVAPSSIALDRAKRAALRERHAEQAEQLAIKRWSAPAGGESYYLIDNVDLRQNYGHLIGKIAASHGWSIDRLASEFSRDARNSFGAPVDCPDEWTVDPLKLACLLRLADAAHIDARRSPGFLHAIRKPSKASDRYWVFQEHLQRPRLVEDRLVYTAPRPFSIDEAGAWWLCFETLQMIDHELSGVDSLMIDCARPRMAARGVKGAESAFRLSDLIPTSGWSPVDAQVTITNVPSLIRKLGGDSLYGSNPHVALRELIQNASDATSALRVITGSPGQPIEVRLVKEEDAWILEVADSGIGMSKEVMTGPLLDFGSSYWGSQLMRSESPELTASDFRATGQFGIGFYSVFMLGDAVRVTSRRFDEGIADTRVLEFVSGLDERPILRPPTTREIRNSPGTVVAVTLTSDPYGQDGLLDSVRGGQTLTQLCAKLAPALPCDLATSEPDGSAITCIHASDWKSMDAEDLICRLGDKVSTRQAWETQTLKSAADKMRPITREGNIVARASLAPRSGSVRMPDGTHMDVACSLTSNGLQISELACHRNIRREARNSRSLRRGRPGGFRRTC